MTKVNFFDIPSLINNSIVDLNICFDGDKTEFRLHHDNTYSWMCNNESDYIKIEDQIKNYVVKGNGFEVFMWCDISGFDYWHNTMNENNYIQISIGFNESTIDISELDNLKAAIIEAMNFAEGIVDSNEVHLI